MSLNHYHQKRNFKKTSEPKGRVHRDNHSLFVIQKHAARALHYDFRLELNGVLKSWAVPKGPCLDPTVKRLAIEVEDHPLEYGTFEGIIPKGQYGAGTVMLWDQGEWKPLDADPLKAYKKGHLRFELNAEKMHGRWDLIRFKEHEWFLCKYKDDFAKELNKYDLIEQEQNSVINHQTMDEIRKNFKGIWTKEGLKTDFLSTELKKTLKEKPFPKQIEVQLATLVDKPPEGKEWLHEVKFDGYRMICFKQRKKLRFQSRNNKDWTPEFSSLVPTLQKLPVENAIFDGEIVILDEEGRSKFQLLQNSIKAGKESSFYYYIFDLLYLENYDLRELPLIERKTILASVLEGADPALKYSDHIRGQGQKVLKQSCDFALEGIVSKRADSSYLGKRNKSWLKIKCSKRQEFVVGGFSKPSGSRQYFGSLYLGLYNERGEFEFSGNVGTGFTSRSLETIYQTLKALIVQKNPFTLKPPQAKNATWVKPNLVVEVEFTEKTQEGRLRHPSFKGVRMDKKAKEVIEEKPLALAQVLDKKSEENPISSQPIKLSNLDKILYKEDKISKQELYEYYQIVSQKILPQISQRPLTLVRCPSGYQDCFYQKHLAKETQSLHQIPITNKKGKTEYSIYISDELGLFNLVQLGVLEIHPWGSSIHHLNQPDRIIFDLDPDPDLEWKKVVKAAFHIKEVLSKYQLKTFVKTTGGKGLHLVLPIKPEYDWQRVKEFCAVFVQFLEKSHPKVYVSKMAKSQRKGKIFVDYLRNQAEATAIAAYSSRARIHAPVATPIEWDELSSDYNDTFYTIRTLPKRLAELKRDPWREFWTISQSLRLDELN